MVLVAIFPFFRIKPFFLVYRMNGTVMNLEDFNLSTFTAESTTTPLIEALLYIIQFQRSQW